MGIKAKTMMKLMSLMGSKALDEIDFPDFCRDLITKKNKQHAKAFAAAPFSERLVFMPQCIRSTDKCQAREESAEYICVGCGACKAAEIVSKGAELGYMGVFILKGGSAVSRLIEKKKPQAVLGIACHFEGALGILECERQGVPVQCVPLLRDGCADTDFELNPAIETMMRAT
jgi:uncharacterized protein